MVAYLNIHTSYDLLNSSLRISDVVKKLRMKELKHLQSQILMFCMAILNFMMRV